MIGTRQLHGMTYRGFEITLDVGHTPKELTKAIRRILEEAGPRFYLHSVSCSPEPYNESLTVYTVVVAG